jgi:hypothetical protein
MFSVSTVTLFNRIAPIILLVFICICSIVCFILRCTSSVTDEEALYIIAFLTLIFEIGNSLLHVNHL